MRTLRARRDGRSRVAIGEGLEGDVIRYLLETLEVGSMLRRGDTVTVVPNWVNQNAPATGTVVGPESLRQLLRCLREKGSADIVVAAGSGGTETPQIMEQTGYGPIIREEGADFVDLNYGPYVEYEIDFPGFNRIQLNRLVEDSDLLISFTQIKHHEEATVSLGLKNIALSWPPAEIHGFPKADRGIHEHLHEFITAMCRLIPIDISILSGDQGMVGSGPSAGKPVNADLVVAGTDPVATDTVGARLLGFRPQAVRHLHDLILAGVGEGELNRVELMGMPLDQAEGKFTRAAYGQEVVVDSGQLKPLHLRAGVPGRM